MWEVGCLGMTSFWCTDKMQHDMRWRWKALPCSWSQQTIWSQTTCSRHSLHQMPLIDFQTLWVENKHLLWCLDLTSGQFDIHFISHPSKRGYSSLSFNIFFHMSLLRLLFPYNPSFMLLYQFLLFFPSACYRIYFHVFCAILF